MKDQPAFSRLIFEGGFEARDEFETPAKGYRGDVLAELSDGSRYRVTFYDPVRLAQDLESEVEVGKAFLAEPGLIVVPEVTLLTMEHAVRELVEQGFFETLRPVNLKR